MGAPVEVTGASSEPTRTPFIDTEACAERTPSTLATVCSREASMGWLSDPEEPDCAATLGPMT